MERISILTKSFQATALIFAITVTEGYAGKIFPKQEIACGNECLASVTQKPGIINSCWAHKLNSEAARLKLSKLDPSTTEFKNVMGKVIFNATKQCGGSPVSEASHIQQEIQTCLNRCLKR